MTALSELSVAEIKKLGSQGQLFFEGKKVVVDPFTQLTFFYEIEVVESGEAIVAGKINVGQKVYGVEAFSAVFTRCALLGSLLQFFETPLPRAFLKEPLFLSKEELALFIKSCEKASDAPDLVWKNKSQVVAVEPKPILMLKDRAGAFADLWMDYGLLGKKRWDLLQQMPSGIGKKIF